MISIKNWTKRLSIIKWDYLTVTLTTIVVLLLGWLFIYSFITPNTDNIHVHLAYSFVNGQVHLLDNSELLSHPKDYYDVVQFNGRYYWHQGPFPAILLTPFVFIFNLFNKIFYQGYIQFFLVLFTAIAFYKVIKKLNYSVKDSFYLVLVFLAGSVYLTVAIINGAVYYSQIITVFLLVLALFEYYGKKRYWLIGVLFGCLALTRVTASLGIVFFIFEIIFSKNKKSIKKHLITLLLPFIIISNFQLLYNHARFGDILESGYAISVDQPIDPNNIYTGAYKYGFFSLRHLPTNLYYLLLATPLPVFQNPPTHVLGPPFIRINPWGMSIFLTSPYLIYLFFLKIRDKTSWFLLATVIIIAIPILLYFGIGYVQCGYRYALDFWPFLFLLLAKNYSDNHRVLSTGIKILFLVSIIINIIFFTIFQYYSIFQTNPWHLI